MTHHVGYIINNINFIFYTVLLLQFIRENSSIHFHSLFGGLCARQYHGFHPTRLRTGVSSASRLASPLLLLLRCWVFLFRLLLRWRRLLLRSDLDRLVDLKDLSVTAESDLAPALVGRDKRSVKDKLRKNNNCSKTKTEKKSDYIPSGERF